MVSREVSNGTDINSIQKADSPITTTGGTGISVEVSRKKRLRFNSTWDIILLKSVVFNEAHIVRHGEAQQKFEDVLKQFIIEVPNHHWLTTTKPTWKSLNDRFKKVVADHRTSRRANEAASGIIEIRGEREELLDDIVLAVDEKEEERRTEREERTAMDRRLQGAGEEIRNRAVGSIVSSDEVQITPPTPPSSTNSIVGSHSRRRAFESDEDDRVMLDDHIRRMSAYESKRLKIDEETMKLQRDSEKNMNERLNREHELNERRLSLEEKRFQILERRHQSDSEERKLSIAERKEMSGLLLALTKELTKKSNS